MLPFSCGNCFLGLLMFFPAKGAIVRATYFYMFLWEEGCGCGSFPPSRPPLQIASHPLLAPLPQGSTYKVEGSGQPWLEHRKNSLFLSFPDKMLLKWFFLINIKVCFKVTCCLHLWTQKGLALHNSTSPATPLQIRINSSRDYRPAVTQYVTPWGIHVLVKQLAIS